MVSVGFSVAGHHGESLCIPSLLQVGKACKKAKNITAITR